MSHECATRSLQLEQDYHAQASELGLVIPEISITDKVDLRLARSERTIEYDGEILLGGVLAAQLENKTKVTVDALPKSTSTDKLTTDYEYDRYYQKSALLRIDTSPSAEKNSQKELNRAFWLGTLVLDELAEGNEHLHRQERSKKFTRIQIGATAGALAVSFSDNALEWTGVASFGPEVDIASIAAQAGLLGAFYYRNFKKNGVSRPITDYIAEQKSDQATELARNYPVFTHGFTQDLEV